MIPVIIAAPIIQTVKAGGGAPTVVVPHISYPIYTYQTSVASGTSSQHNAMSQPVLVRRNLESGEIVKRLGLQDSYVTATPRSLRTINDDTTAYQVPTGHTAKIIAIVKGASASTDTPIIRETATPDTNTGTIKFRALSFDNLNAQSNLLVTFSPDWHTTEVSFAASTYITFAQNNSGNGSIIVSAVVIETPDP